MGWGAADLKYRFQWTAPILVSAHALYFAAQVLFRSLDEGQSWTVISPDLTRNDKSKQLPSGGPLTKDNTSVEIYDTIFALAESPVDPNLLWVGTDDGLVQLSRDAGAHWRAVTPKDMPEWATVDMIEADPTAPGTAYVAADRHRLDDRKPYAFKTTDFGQTWTAITTGLPDEAYVHVVRRDPARAGLLYAGTERGVFVSYDDGAHWQCRSTTIAPRKTRRADVPQPRLLLHWQGGEIVAPDDLSTTPDWAKPIVAAALKAQRPRR